jgi:exosortase
MSSFQDSIPLVRFLKTKIARPITNWPLIVSLAVLALGLLWAFWPILSAMAERWSNDPRYAHGYLVPMFSLALLWMRRSQRPRGELRPSSRGLAFIASGAVVLLVGGYFRQGTIEGLAILSFLAGVAMLVGGWPAVRWSWPSIMFLFFMIPLPWRIENALGPPLQWLATLASTFTLQTLGFMAFAEGNVIQLNDAQIGVVEACSGLSMVITFITLSVGMALVVNHCPLLDKILLVLSAIPVALLANVARITLTGVLHETISGQIAGKFYHDLAGWVMIPFALVLYWCEIWLFSHILVEAEKTPILIGIVNGSRRSANRLPRQLPTLPRASRGH